MSILKTTKLGAVNTLLATIGESPLNTLSNIELIDGVTAEQTLDEITLEILGEGWRFNTSEEFTLKPRSFEPKFTELPPNALQVFLLDKRENLRVRGERLFDEERQSFDMGPIGNVKARIFWAYPFDELPESARRYITIRSARIYQDRFVGSDSIHSYTMRDEMMAYNRLKRFEARSSRPNLLSNSVAARVLNR